VDDGSRIRLSGEGNIGIKGGPPGDLYLTVSVKRHPLFTRQNDAILYELSINFAEAALGTEVEVPTLEGTARLKIPAGSQGGQVFRLKNKGIPHLRGRKKGDQFVTLLVVTPESLTKKQKELFKELASTLNSVKKSR
jgi:molecular chaperone DnaJ